MDNEVTSFFEIAGSSFVMMLATCIYPYGFLWLGLELYSRNNEENTPTEDNSSLIRFHDEYNKLRFVIASGAVMRCHRSYFINPAYIRIVHRDSSGLIVADLNQDGYESIPISRKYQDTITKLL